MDLINMKAIDQEVGYKSIIESLLFVWGEPLSGTKIASILEVKPSTVEKIIHEMMAQFESENRGVQIVEVNKKYQLASRKDNFPYIEKLCVTTKSKGLSNSALEVLTIVAYQQPITKLDIEQVRGVNCDSPIQSLIERGLVEVVGKLERIGRPQIYGTTDLFLKSFGFKSLKDLPNLEDFGGKTIFESLKENEEEGAEDDRNQKAES
ncbi:SMC-Scp complex subunit ScpB [Fusibacter tunisiensis]|uniref:Segregation and condensation protein B n=1 Tax=Fusibacter tunisiensis TaxID=1008308 RepID=A0ABS2MQ64_9FIRM|nr:SMC-Scp complex subunit ScpB [Fusibacter tunisiensis]MBM7561548.1 segregation and condensation protein B [Fusibacter tunisiensis]